MTNSKEKLKTKGGTLANFIISTAIFFLFLLFTYTIIRRTALTPMGLKTYSIVSLAGILICIWAFKWQQELKVNFSLAIVSICFIIYLLEFFAFLSIGEGLDIKERVEIAKKKGIPFDNRTKKEVIHDFTDKGITAYPTVHPSLLINSNGLELKGKSLYPLAGISNTTTVFCNESGKYNIYKSDEHGFNNPPGSWAEESIDIVLIGDSYVQGACVERDKDIRGNLREMGYGTISLGIAGNGPLIELATIKEYAKRLKPRILLFLYFEQNDILDLVNESNSPLLMNYLKKDFSQNLFSRQNEIDQSLVNYINEERKNEFLKVTLINFIKLYHLRVKLGLKEALSCPMPPPPPLLFKKILENSYKTVSSWGGKMYFVYLPDWSRYAKNIDHPTFFHRTKVLSVVKELNIPIIDIHEEIFSSHPDPLELFPFRIYGHYTEEAYSLIARDIATHLQREGKAANG